MYNYKVIKMEYNGTKSLSVNGLDIVVVRSFIGPGINGQYDYGLYAGDDLDLFTFFYKDSQEKL